MWIRGMNTQFWDLYPLRYKLTHTKTPTDKCTLEFVQKHPCTHVNACTSIRDDGIESHMIKKVT